MIESCSKEIGNDFSNALVNQRVNARVEHCMKGKDVFGVDIDEVAPEFVWWEMKADDIHET